MTLRMVGSHEVSVPAGVREGYKNSIAAWATRAALEVNDKVGFAHGTIEHLATAASATAAIKIVDRCCGFDPAVGLKRNTFGVLEFTGAKPNLERRFRPLPRRA